MSKTRIALAVAVLLSVSGCGVVAGTETAPSCESTDRVALIAQSVPSASYLPCLATLAPGWTSRAFAASSGHTRFSLASDRSAGHPVRVALAPTCDLTDATPIAPRAAGVRTYSRLRTISPRYAGTLMDVFAGGCVTYAFDFVRGPHIALIEEFENAVTLYPREELAVKVRQHLHVRLDP